MEGAWTPVFHAIADAEAWTIYLIGDFDQDGVAEFERAWAVLADLQLPRVTIDLSDTAFLASAGLGCLVRARASGVEIGLRGVRPAQRKLLTLTALGDVFDISDAHQPAPSSLELTV